MHVHTCALADTNMAVPAGVATEGILVTTTAGEPGFLARRLSGVLQGCNTLPSGDPITPLLASSLRVCAGRYGVTVNPARLAKVESARSRGVSARSFAA